ncbi:unnamed protein product [Rotaria socialis]|uniref:Uncharacterized protein n=1 Tax=Rotaria socialis TaxID=392032 RepID=A0A820KVM8_9BILA|nr:unnamed protein product [Rotaria socialis]CAF4346228.1 unnamed protein product [Rotaria socialis]
MVACYRPSSNETIACDTSTAAYFVVGVILPLLICVTVILISVYVRHKNNRLRREQQQMNIGTVLAINNMMDERIESDSYPYPPNYTATTDTFYDKPPTYEQSLHRLQEIHNATEEGAAILPDRSISSSTTELFRTSQNFI